MGDELTFPTFCDEGLREIEIKGRFTVRVKGSRGRNTLTWRLQSDNDRVRIRGHLMTPLELIATKGYAMCGLYDYEFQRNKAKRVIQTPYENQVYLGEINNLAENEEFKINLVFLPTYTKIASKSLLAKDYLLFHGFSSIYQDRDARMDTFYISGANVKITSVQMSTGGRLSDRLAYGIPEKTFENKTCFNLDLEEIATGERVVLFDQRYFKSPSGLYAMLELGIRGKLGSAR